MIDLAKRWQVIEGDCLEILKQLPDGCVDAVMTDPPYGINHSSGYGATWKNTTIANDHSTEARDSVVAWCERFALPWASFGSWKQPAPSGTVATLVWDKGAAFGMGDLSFPWKPSWDEIYIGGRGWSGPRRDEGVIRGHFCSPNEINGRVHPHEKPISLLRYLLSRLPDGVMVLDPFAGSGTTGVACMQTGRRFIGIEIDPGYCAIARRRIAAAADTLWTPEPARESEPMLIGDHP